MPRVPLHVQYNCTVNKLDDTATLCSSALEIEFHSSVPDVEPSTGTDRFTPSEYTSISRTSSDS